MSTPRQPLRWLALGDSYTVGEGVDPAGTWPMQLARALRAGGIALADPQVIATTGWTTDELDAAIDAAAPAAGFDLCSLLIGVNNQYRGRGVDEYREQFAALRDWLENAYQHKASGKKIPNEANPGLVTDFRYDVLSRKMEKLCLDMLEEKS